MTRRLSATSLGTHAAIEVFSRAVSRISSTDWSFLGRSFNILHFWPLDQQVCFYIRLWIHARRSACLRLYHVRRTNIPSKASDIRPRLPSVSDGLVLIHGSVSGTGKPRRMVKAVAPRVACRENVEVCSCLNENIDDLAWFLRNEV